MDAGAGLSAQGGPVPRVIRRLPGIPTVAVLVLLAVSMTACSPDYNWREVRSGDDHWNAMLPAKPVSASRDILLNGQDAKVQMRMQGAQVGDSTFAVAAVTVPQNAQEAVGAMRQAMVRNLSGKETGTSQVVIPTGRESAVVPGTATPAAAGEDGVAVEVEGTINGRPARMIARFVAHHQRAYQVVAVGTDLDVGQARLFVESFALSD